LLPPLLAIKNEAGSGSYRISTRLVAFQAPTFWWRIAMKLPPSRSPWEYFRVPSGRIHPVLASPKKYFHSHPFLLFGSNLYQRLIPSHNTRQKTGNLLTTFWC
jgi:hypothetical protein